MDIEIQNIKFRMYILLTPFMWATLVATCSWYILMYSRGMLINRAKMANVFIKLIIDICWVNKLQEICEFFFLDLLALCFPVFQVIYPLYPMVIMNIKSIAQAIWIKLAQTGLTSFEMNPKMHNLTNSKSSMMEFHISEKIPEDSVGSFFSDFHSLLNKMFNQFSSDSSVINFCWMWSEK